MTALLLKALKNESVEDLKELIDFEVVDEDVHQRFKDVSANPFFDRPCSSLASAETERLSLKC